MRRPVVLAAILWVATEHGWLERDVAAAALERYPNLNAGDVELLTELAEEMFRREFEPS